MGRVGLHPKWPQADEKCGRHNSFSIQLPQSFSVYSSFHRRHVEVDSLDSNSRDSPIVSEMPKRTCSLSSRATRGILVSACAALRLRQTPRSLASLGTTNLASRIISVARPGCRAHTHSAAQTSASPRRAASAGKQFASWPSPGWKEKSLESPPPRRRPSPRK